MIEEVNKNKRLQFLRLSRQAIKSSHLKFTWDFRILSDFLKGNKSRMNSRANATKAKVTQKKTRVTSICYQRLFKKS